MTGTEYLALLRGINVGGSNVIRMADLRQCLADDGFEAVATYIQSGNVLFSAAGPAAALAERIESVLTRQFSYAARAVVLGHHELRRVVEEAPPGFGADPSTYKYDVLFVRAPLTVGEALGAISLKDGVDDAFAGPGAVYFRRLSERAAQSRLSRFAGLPPYQNVTIRNWNTTTKLLALLDARSGAA